MESFSYILIKEDSIVEVHTYLDDLSIDTIMSSIANELNRSSDCFYTEYHKTSIPHIKYICGEDYSEQVNGSKLMKAIVNRKAHYGVDYNVAIYRTSFFNKRKIISLKRRDIEKVVDIALNNKYEVKYIIHEL